jgi:hypothetical protein
LLETHATFFVLIFETLFAIGGIATNLAFVKLRNRIFSVASAAMFEIIVGVERTRGTSVVFSKRGTIKAEFSPVKDT